MKYTTQQQKYIDSIDGQAHMTALEIIGLLETEVEKLKQKIKDLEAWLWD